MTSDVLLHAPRVCGDHFSRDVFFLHERCTNNLIIILLINRRFFLFEQFDGAIVSIFHSLVSGRYTKNHSVVSMKKKKKKKGHAHKTRKQETNRINIVMSKSIELKHLGCPSRNAIIEMKYIIFLIILFDFFCIGRCRFSCWVLANCNLAHRFPCYPTCITLTNLR